MSYYQDFVKITMTASKENAVRMLNAAICNAGTGNVIVEGDDMETINRKIREEDGHYGIRVSIPDFLDDECMKDTDLQKAKEEFENEDHSNWEGEYCEARMIDILHVAEDESGYCIDMELYFDEYSSCRWWAKWEDLVRMYGCRIVYDDETYNKGCYIDFVTLIFELKKGEVTMTRIYPEYPLTNFNDAYEKLIKFDPLRYRPRKIRDYKQLIADLQEGIEREEMLLERDQLMAEHHVEINPYYWKQFNWTEEKGAEELEKVFDDAVKSYARWGDAKIEEIENILRFRAEKLKGQNDDIAECYERLLAKLPDVFAEAKKEEEKNNNGKKDYSLPF